MKPAALLLALAACTALSACCKEEEAPAPTRFELIAGKDWRLIRLTSHNERTRRDTIDIFAQMPPCERDNIFLFRADGSYLNTEGAIPCSPPGTRTGTWSLNAEQATITIYVPTYAPLGIDIASLNSDEMIGKRRISTSGSTSYIETFTFVKQ
jgi:hypothetical protein